MRKLPAVVALTCVLAAAAPTTADASPPGSALTRAQPAPSFNSTVWAIAFRGDVVYVGGSFTSLTSRGRTFDRRRLAAFDARTGAVLPWQPAANGTVRSLAVTGSVVYAAGNFDHVNRLNRDAVAMIDATTGRVAPFAHRITGEPATLAIGNGRVYLGGEFSAVDGVPRRNVAAFQHRTGRLDQAWRPAADNRVHGIAVTRHRVYLGGDFSRLNGDPGAARVAAVAATNGRLVKAFRAAAPAGVLDIAADARGVYTGTSGPGGRAVGYSLSGAVRWTHLFDGDVHTIAVLRGITYAGGHFDRACRTTSTIKQLGCPAGYAPRVKLAAVDRRGKLTSWNPRANGTAGTQVLTADPKRHRIGAGGAFTTIGGSNRERFALFE